jgi:hypothetical protein
VTAADDEPVGSAPGHRRDTPSRSPGEGVRRRWHPAAVPPAGSPRWCGAAVSDRLTSGAARHQDTPIARMCHAATRSVCRPSARRWTARTGRSAGSGVRGESGRTGTSDEIAPSAGPLLLTAATRPRMLGPETGHRLHQAPYAARLAGWSAWAFRCPRRRRHVAAMSTLPVRRVSVRDGAPLPGIGDQVHPFTGQRVNRRFIRSFLWSWPVGWRLAVHPDTTNRDWPFGRSAVKPAVTRSVRW